MQLIGKDLLLLYKKWLNLIFVEVLDQEAGEHLWFQGRSSSATVLSQPLILFPFFSKFTTLLPHMRKIHFILSEGMMKSALFWESKASMSINCG